jgi:hypothetical protein
MSRAAAIIRASWWAGIKILADGVRARARVCVTHMPGHARKPVASATLRACPAQRWLGKPERFFGEI